jgi:hypothetical protein
MKEFVQRVVADRVAGGRPSPARAVIAATAVGVAVAGATYRVLRR